MNVLVEETSLQEIANAIREKNGSGDKYKPSEMASAISSIVSGGGLKVLNGEVTHSTLKSKLILTHNLGKKCPFIFYVQCTEPNKLGTNEVYSITVYIPTLETQNITTSLVENVGITPPTMISVAIVNANGVVQRIGSADYLTLVDEEPTVASLQNYKVSMWDNGFGFAFYRNMISVPYKYTLIYDEGVGMNEIL